MQNRNNGFSLIDMMITLGILGALTAIAIPTFTGYVSIAQTSVVRNHFDEAKHIVRMSFAKAHMRRAIGHQASLPQSSEEWISLLNSNDATSPEGGLAYVIGSGTINPGQIGIEGSGSFPETAAVVITQPSYKGLEERQVTISASDAL